MNIVKNVATVRAVVALGWEFQKYFFGIWYFCRGLLAFMSPVVVWFLLKGFCVWLFSSPMVIHLAVCFSALSRVRDIVRPGVDMVMKVEKLYFYSSFSFFLPSCLSSQIYLQTMQCFDVWIFCGSAAAAMLIIRGRRRSSKRIFKTFSVIQQLLNSFNKKNQSAVAKSPNFQLKGLLVTV